MQHLIDRKICIGNGRADDEGTIDRQRVAAEMLLDGVEVADLGSFLVLGQVYRLVCGEEGSEETCTP